VSPYADTLINSAIGVPSGPAWRNAAHSAVSGVSGPEVLPGVGSALWGRSGLS